MSQKKRTNSKYTEDWLPIKSIANGMIELENKFKVTGVKIRPRNIFILESNLRNNIISQLRIFYDTLDFEFWFISADRPVDISDYLATLQIQYNNEQNPILKKLISQDIQKANDFVRDNVTDTEFYILFKERNPDVIQKRLRTLMMGLSNAGLDSVQTSNTDLRVILESFLNGGMTTEGKAVLPE